MGMMRGLFAFVLVLFSMSVMALAGERVGSFAKLPVGDVMVVEYSSSGCFHSFGYEFVFEGGKAKVTSVVHDWSGNKKAVVKTEGEVVLSKEDLKGLDRLVKFYRAISGGGCTTVDTITITRRRGGKVVATEKFVDATCGTYDRKDLMTFARLGQRLKE